MRNNIIRIFLAIPIGAENCITARTFINLNSGLEGIKWTKDLNMHVTLYFIGETERFNLNTVVSRLEKTAKDLHSFTLDFDKYELMGNIEKPSMVWATFQKSEGFSNAAITLEKAMAFASTNPNHFSDPIPHCTLGRIKEKIRKEDFNYSAKPLKPIEVKSIELWQTTGGIYERLGSVDLISE